MQQEDHSADFNTQRAPAKEWAQANHPFSAVAAVAVFRILFESTLFRVLILVLLFSSAAVKEAARLSAFLNPDIWWHLRTGIWILQSRSVPHTGLFSQYPSLPWMASSWAYDVVLAVSYKMLGLRAIPFLLMCGKAALAATVFVLARGWKGLFWFAVVITAIALYAIGDVSGSALVSVIFFAIELHVLSAYRRSGNLRSLGILCPMFLVWANVHIQFVFGLLLLAWFALVVLAEALLSSSGFAGEQAAFRPSVLKAVGITALCVAFTFLTPYTYHLLSIAQTELYSDVAIGHFSEMKSMGFRRPHDYVTLLFVMSTLLVLGYQRSLDLFKLGTIAIGMAVAFRFQREIWLVILPCVAALASGVTVKSRSKGANLEWVLSAAVVVLVLGVSCAQIPSDDNKVVRKAGAIVPIAACDFIRQSRLPPPLFNSYAEGGFLTWYLPEYPVIIDGRLGLYGEDITAKHFAVSEGKARLEEDPAFSNARTILLEKDSALAKALTTIPQLASQFRVAYRDDVAVVLVRD